MRWPLALIAAVALLRGLPAAVSAPPSDVGVATIAALAAADDDSDHHTTGDLCEDDGTDDDDALPGRLPSPPPPDAQRASHGRPVARVVTPRPRPRLFRPPPARA